MRVAIIGAGRQGLRRASALAVEGSNLVAVADSDRPAAERLAMQMGAQAFSNWEAVIELPDVEAVIVCTLPHLHAAISIAAMEARKHVLCEKPLARTVEEAAAMVHVARQQSVTLKCGFNLRHHAVVRQVRHWVDQGALGDLFFVRARYGIGGRPGYDQEWRANAKVSGGGQLMDQGVHLLDLCRWFLGDFTSVVGFLATYFWEVSPLEDNAFALLQTRRGQVASLHVSWTQWKPLFSFEVFGSEGYALAEGLGGAYGTARSILGRRDLTAPFAEESIEFRGEDLSWREEWREFVAAVREQREPLGNGQDGLEALRLAQAIYEASRTGTLSLESQKGER